MRLTVILILMLFAACGTKRNTDRCCVDEADCARLGLPVGSGCTQGELCRGNECVELTCSLASECDLTAPYCETGLCSEQCTSDASCPGFNQDVLSYCVAGSCVQCRDDANDCVDGLVCANNTCGLCTNDDQCLDGACGNDGRCTSASNISFAAADGSATSMCTKSSPCSLARALTLTREQIRLAAGLYESPATITLTNKRFLKGAGIGQTRLTNLGTGPVLITSGGSEVALESLEIFGAKTGAMPGNGVRSASMSLQLTDVSIRANASDGLFAGVARVSRSSITDNGGYGVKVSVITAGQPEYLIERSIIMGNATGIQMTGAGAIRNVFVVRNAGVGVEISSSQDVLTPLFAAIDFSTIADNGSAGILCAAGPAAISSLVSNVIVSRDSIVNDQILSDGTLACTVSRCFVDYALTGQNTTGCSFPSSDYMFVSPNTAPFNYHIGSATSAAVNSVPAGTNSIDFDGDARPKGAAADVGADEAF